MKKELLLAWTIMFFTWWVIQGISTLLSHLGLAPGLASLLGDLTIPIIFVTAFGSRFFGGKGWEGFTIADAVYTLLAMIFVACAYIYIRDGYFYKKPSR